MKILVSDFDGVIADSLDVFTKAFVYAFKAEKIDIDMATMRSMLGKRMQDILSQLITDKSYDPEDLINRLKKNINTYLLSPEARAEYKLRDGAKDFLDFLDREFPVPRIVLSNSTVEYIAAFMSRTGIADRWTRIIGSDSGYERKSLALSSLAKEFRLEPKDVLFIGDTVFDMQEGIDAGVTRIALAGWHSKELLLSTQPDFIADSFEELKEIIEKIKNQ
ncbi:HAD family hydrolase [Candidatus Woesearchaeota archaeon]|nr:MAG: HAD family hydrolase [Candidatus Woesearchaeota archaeon]